jgi:DNA-binding beta-propeller fold protein YncE
MMNCAPNRLWAVFLLVSASGCSSDKPAPHTGDTASETEPLAGVMRDCPEELGTICPWAGAGYNGFNGDEVGRLDAWFSFPMSVTFHPEGTRPPIMADWNNHKLREVLDDPAQGFRTVMGTNFLGDGDPDLADSTEAGAPGTTVNLNHPTQHQWLPEGVLLSASWHTHKLRTWDPATELVHVYLGGAPGFSGVDFEEPGDTTRLNQPKEVLLNPNDANLVYILDMRNQRIRELNRATWIVNTVAGTGEKCIAAEGEDLGDGGSALDACFSFPENDNPEPGGALAMNQAGTTLYIADAENHVLRALDLKSGTIDLLAGGSGEFGDVDGGALDARFHYPTDLLFDDATGQLFIADANNHKVRVLDTSSGEVSTFAGTGEPSCVLDRGLLIPVICDNQRDGGDGGPAAEATLYRPFGINFDADKNLYISDTYNQRIRVVYR